MIRRNLVLGTSLWLATTVSAGAEIYSWTDDQGTVHFTEDRGAVPPKYRGKLRTTGENDETAEKAPPTRDGAEVAAPAPGASGAASTAERFDFSTRDQWQDALQKQEAAMVALRQRLDDIAAAAKGMPRSAERDKLLVEHQTLLLEFKAMKDRYSRLVDGARTAGFQVDLQ
jgi:hypothetical protein